MTHQSVLHVFHPLREIQLYFVFKLSRIRCNQLIRHELGPKAHKASAGNGLAQAPITNCTVLTHTDEHTERTVDSAVRSDALGPVIHSTYPYPTYGGGDTPGPTGRAQARARSCYSPSITVG